MDWGSSHDDQPAASLFWRSGKVWWFDVGGFTNELDRRIPAKRLWCLLDRSCRLGCQAVCRLHEFFRLGMYLAGMASSGVNQHARVRIFADARTAFAPQTLVLNASSDSANKVSSSSFKFLWRGNLVNRSTCQVLTEFQFYFNTGQAKASNIFSGANSLHFWLRGFYQIPQWKLSSVGRNLVYRVFVPKPGIVVATCIRSKVFCADVRSRPRTDGITWWPRFSASKRTVIPIRNRYCCF